ncbi:ribonuclease Z [Methanobacterium alcaliphilum]|uniref:ribonuclease Z n=1 Tax=Methanobacterium alcaliphilum TaxID=392018 RepID=UPI00200B5222|nr:ribonuclease Z [Methanobacterium alcaliphilum]MCK9151222.1 ribonuclease Z [Methanobacterium alcaliphilum]
MELIFLGTSSAVPSKYRNHTAIALKAFGEVFLFDCGEGTQRQMSQIKLSPMKINKIFISHLHGDHILGIPGIIQSMGFRGRKEPLHIYGPPGLNDVLKSALNLGYFSMDFEIHSHELDEGLIIEKEDYKIECVKTQHNVPNLSYSIQEIKKPRFIKEKAIALGLKPGPDFGKLHRGISVHFKDRMIKPEEVLGDERKGIKITYSGDTRPCETMIKLAKDSDILIHESTFEAGQESKASETGHSTAHDAANIAKKAGVKSLILTHISTRYKKSKQLKTAAQEIFKNTMIAEDLMVVEVKTEKF